MAERIRKHAGLLLCFCYGALVPLGFAPFGYYIVPVISVALLLHAWLRCTPKKTFLSGYLFGLGMYGTGVSWLHISINLFGGMNLIGSYLITLLLVLYLACYPHRPCGYWANGADQEFLPVSPGSTSATARLTLPSRDSRRSPGFTVSVGRRC